MDWPSFDPILVRLAAGQRNIARHIECCRADGYAAFYDGVARESLPTLYHKQGWDDADGFEQYLRAMEQDMAYDARTAWQG